MLCILAFLLVLFTNQKTVLLSFAAAALAACYPFMKRYTHLPQIVLGAAFAWSIPMAFAAQQNAMPALLWLIYLAVLLWTTAYDTFYAMVDRDDDIIIGVKSTAILFGKHDRLITALLQLMMIMVMIMVGFQFNLGNWYFAGLAGAAVLFAYQQYLIRYRDRDDCLKAFLNNQWVGAIIFAGIFLHYGLSTH